MSRFPLIAFAFIFVCISARAEPFPPLTWADCLRLAAERNPDLQAAYKSESASLSNYRESYNEILPRASLTNSINDGSGVSRESRWQAGVSASVDLFSLQSYGAIRSASARWRQAQANTWQASSTLLSSLYNSFAGLLYAQQQVDVSNRIRDIRKNNAELIRLRYDSGRESRGNRMRTDAELLEADVDLMQSRRDLRAAQQALAETIGMDDYQALIVTGTFSAGPLPDLPPNLNALVDAQPRTAIQRAVVDQAKAALFSARGSFFPALSANYSRSFRGRTEFPRDSNSWSASGVLSLPLFASGLTSAYYDSQAARLSLESAEQQLRAVRHRVRSDIESAWAAYAQALDQVRVQNAFLEAARQRRRESDVRYENGLMTFENWAQVVTELVNFERSYLRSQRDAVSGTAQWNVAIGTPLGPVTSAFSAAGPIEKE